MWCYNEKKSTDSIEETGLTLSDILNRIYESFNINNLLVLLVIMLKDYREISKEVKEYLKAWYINHRQSNIYTTLTTKIWRWIVW